MWLSNPHARTAFESGERDLRRLERAQYASHVVTNLQRERLELLWNRAEKVPYYRGLPELEERDLHRLPITEKATVKARPGDFLRTDLDRVMKYYETSGSSGRPMETPRLAEDVIHNAIGVSGMWRRVFGSQSCRTAALLPSDVVPVGDFVASVCEYLGHTLLRCYPFTLGICDWDRLEELFANFRPELAFAAPGVLMQWTRILKTRGRLQEIRASLRTWLLLGEVCLPAQRRKLAQDWDANALDASYGSTETGTIAATCEHGGLHMLLPGHVVELRAGGEVRAADPGAGGELIDTTLNNHARPLLRYATGDVVSVDADPCLCGVPLPTMRIDGRQTDDVVLRGMPLTENLVGGVVYDDIRLTGYLVQLRGDGRGGRLVLERDVDVDGVDPDLAAGVRRRSAEVGIAWDDIVVVSQLPAGNKAGGSRKSWKRTNVVIVR